MITVYVLLAIVILAIIIIPQSETKIVERLGKYYATLGPGINVIVPFIDRAKEVIVMRGGRYIYSNVIDLREQVYVKSIICPTP